jgi:hypothetical protein
MNQRDLGAGVADRERHPQRVQDQVVRMLLANCQPTILRL